VTVITGTTGDGSDLDYPRLASTPGTLVVFMGLGRLDELATGLIEHGRDAATPAALIASGTLPEQRVVVAPLVRIADAAEDIDPPALVVIGDVVGLAELLMPAAHEVAA